MIADTHFGDDGSIIRYEKRPFANELEMRKALIENWNKVVGPEDTVYHLGDFASNLSWEETKQSVEALNGRKILIMGNHDQHFSPRQWLDMGFEEVYPLPVIYQGFYMLSHEPLYVNWASPYANVFGHVHANPAYRDYSERSFCVCVERHGYAPVDFEVIKGAILGESSRKSQMQKKTIVEAGYACYAQIGYKKSNVAIVREKNHKFTQK